MKRKLKSIVVILGLSLLYSCSSTQRAEYVCSCQDLEKVNTFVTTNIKAANNMADEEMEDVIHQLWVTGVLTTCHQQLIWQDDRGNIDWDMQKLDSCATVIETYKLL